MVLINIRVVQIARVSLPFSRKSLKVTLCKVQIDVGPRVPDTLPQTTGLLLRNLN